MPFGVAGGFFSPKFFDFRVSSFDDRMSRVDDRTSLVCMIGVGMAGVVLSYRVTLNTAALPAMYTIPVLYRIGGGTAGMEIP